MNRPKATLSDILGSRTPCYFSSQGERPFRYSDRCRDCNGIKICENYIPSRVTQGQVGQAFESRSSRGENPHPTVNKPYSPMIVRPKWKTKILPKNYQDWIQKYRDSQDGVV